MLSNENKNTLEACQYSALRIIYRSFFNKSTKKQTTNKELLEKSGLETIETRASKLFTDYYNNGIYFGNELLMEMVEDYSNFKNTHPEKTETLLDLHKIPY